MGSENFRDPKKLRNNRKFVLVYTVDLVCRRLRLLLYRLINIEHFESPEELLALSQEKPDGLRRTINMELGWKQSLVFTWNF